MTKTPEPPQPEPAPETPARRSSWRAAFSDAPLMIREIAIVVIGIVLAFTVDRIATDMATARATADIDRALQAEVAPSLDYLDSIVALSDCRLAYVDQLAERTRAGEIDTTAMMSVSLRPWRRAVWTSAQAAGGLEAMDRARLTAFTDIYAGIAALDVRQFDILDRMIAAHGGLQDGAAPSDRAAAQITIRQLRADLAMTRMIAEQTLVDAAAIGMAPTDDQRTANAENAEQCIASLTG